MITTAVRSARSMARGAPQLSAARWCGRRPPGEACERNVSSESIATSAQASSGARPCPSCGAALADDQRYCLECGERRPPTSNLLAASHPAGTFGPQGAARPPTPPATTPPARGEGSAGRQNALLVLAGVGVLLLAMGVGVLIGRSGNGKQGAAAPQVISVASTPAATPAAAEPTFSSDWSSSTSGYTVQLQALPVSSTKVSAVQAAKAAASAKGAKGVGALRSEDFSSLKAGSYVIYSGVYHTKAEAEKALRSLKKSFPSATVIKVSGSAGAAASEPTSASEAAEEAKEGNVVGQSLSHPAPPSVVQQNHNSKGRSFEQKSKNLPNVISTG
jgi:hypothetical protein